MQADGDFIFWPDKPGLGRKTSNPRQQLFWPYLNAWIAMAAHRLGRCVHVLKCMYTMIITRAFTYTHERARAHTHTHAYTCMHTRTHARTHTHTHTHSHSPTLTST